MNEERPEDVQEESPKERDAETTSPPQEKTIGVTIKDMRIELKDTMPNRKTLSVLIRELKDGESGKPIFTFQEIADNFGYADRRNPNNFYREFHASGEDFLEFLSRKNTLKEAVFPVIEAQILAAPLLSPHAHYVAFTQQHPDVSISEATFRTYVNEIESVKILKRRGQLVSGKDGSLNVGGYVRELLEMATFSPAKSKEIVQEFPDVKQAEASTPSGKALDVSCPGIQKKVLVVLLYTCNVSQEMLALLFGVGKTSIHNWIYAVCTDELNGSILKAITCWSGQVSFDEKWLWIDERWHFALCAVDMVTGFPLFIELYPTLKEENWTLFFLHFKRLYGLPTLIISDGSRSLAAARKQVFKHVRFQLCTFHKLKNLMKRIRVHVHDAKMRIRCVRLAKHIFSNTYVSSRKHAAKTLQKLAGKPVSSYLDRHILGCWRKLSMSLTNNAAERFNRKITKCFFGRYGIPSTESAEVLLRGLWLKELLLNGQKHLDANSTFTSINVSSICQEHLDMSKILHFFHDDSPSHIEKRA